MRAVDTNIIVRYLTDDNAEQSAQARRVIDGSQVFICTTVLLETAWVLGSVYAYSAAAISSGLRALAGLPHITLEDPTALAQALDWTEHGMDFADALHLTKASGCDAFISFDRPLARAARRLGATTVRTPSTLHP